MLLINSWFQLCTYGLCHIPCAMGWISQPLLPALGLLGLRERGQLLGPPHLGPGHGGAPVNSVILRGKQKNPRELRLRGAWRCPAPNEQRPKRGRDLLMAIR